MKNFEYDPTVCFWFLERIGNEYNLDFYQPKGIFELSYPGSDYNNIEFYDYFENMKGKFL